MNNLADYIIKNRFRGYTIQKRFIDKAIQTEVENEECCICFESNYLTKTNCNHSICCSCLISLPNVKCPLCRKNLILPDEIRKAIIKKNNLREMINTNRVIDVSNQEQFPPL